MKLKIALVAAFFNWWVNVQRLLSILCFVAAFLFK